MQGYFGLDSKVRFAGVCDDSGGIKFGGSAKELRIFCLRMKLEDQICRPWPDGL